MLLRAEGIVKRYGGLLALDGVSFDLPAGETLGLIGPNGAGKSSLVEILAGAQRADAGRVYLDGRRVDRLPPDGRARRGLIRCFQQGRLFPSLSVMENMLLGAERLRPRPREAALAAKARGLLAGFGDRLLPRLDRPAASLSYANRRRLELARALMADPLALLLDEPSAGMNPTESAELGDFLLGLKAGGQTMLVIEHKLDLIARLADAVLALDGGAALAYGPPDAVAADPRVLAAYLGRAGAQA